MTSESPAAKSTVEEASTPAQSKTLTPKHVFEGHKGGITCIVFLHDNVHIVSGSRDGTMRKWNCDTGLLVGEPWKGEGRSVFALALSPDGKTIACGRENGSVQQWNTDGEMIEGVWVGHSNWVRSLSWSPSGSHLASGSDDGIMLIRNAESGQVELGPIKTEQSAVCSLAYSPLGDRIASGGLHSTICVWDSKTSELVVGPIKDLGDAVTSLVWSSDGTKLYSASDNFSRVFDSVSGAELHRFKHPNHLYSVALSPKGNVLACVGSGCVAQLWDTETLQQLGQPFGQENNLRYVSLSPHGRYLAYGGNDHKFTLWLVNEIAPELAVDASTTIEDAAPEEEETRPESPSSSFLDLEAKNPRGRPGDHREEGIDDRYKNFFRSSKISLSLAPSESDSRPFYRSFWTFAIPSRQRPRENKALPSKERHQRTLFRRRARSKPPIRVPATTDSTKPTLEGKVRAGEYVEESHENVDCPGKSLPGARNNKISKGKQREGFPVDTQTSPLDDPSLPAEDREDQYEFRSSAPSGASHRNGPGNESIPLQQRSKRSFFAQHSRPRPVTIFAGRQKMLRYTSPRAFRAKPSSAAAQSPAQPRSTTPNQQQPQAQSQGATQSAGPRLEDYDYGCWGNFCLQVLFALCCISRGVHPVSES